MALGLLLRSRKGALNPKGHAALLECNTVRFNPTNGKVAPVPWIKSPGINGIEQFRTNKLWKILLYEQAHYMPQC